MVMPGPAKWTWYAPSCTTGEADAGAVGSPFWNTVRSLSAWCPADAAFARYGPPGPQSLHVHGEA